MRAATLALACTFAALPLAAQTWGPWAPATREAPVELRLAAPTAGEEARQELRWELVNRSDLFHFEFVFAFARPDTPGLPATPGSLLRLAPGQVLSGRIALPWNPERGVNAFVAGLCALPSATATPTCLRPGAPALPPGREAEAAWERYREQLEKARQGDPEGLAGVAEVLAKGIGSFLPRDPAAAVVFHTRAADGGRVNSMLELADAYDHGTWIPADPEAATRWYARAAEQDELFAIHTMIERSHAGLGMARNPPETLRWVRKGLTAGDLEAVVWLGRLRQAGLPIAQVEWTEAKARLDQAEETPELQTYVRAMLLEEGLEGPADPVKATEGFVAAADGGNNDALLKVAQRLLEGQHGLRKDPVLASALLDLMAEDLVPRTALALRDRVAQELPPAQRARAEALVRTFRQRMDKAQAFGLKAHLAKARS